VFAAFALSAQGALFAPAFARGELEFDHRYAARPMAPDHARSGGGEKKDELESADNGRDRPSQSVPREFHGGYVNRIAAALSTGGGTATMSLLCVSQILYLKGNRRGRTTSGGV
jgi:hypothetical protein